MTPTSDSTFRATYRAVATQTTVAANSFSRSVTSGWGAADIGGSWRTSAFASTASVANGAGLFRLDGPRSSASEVLPNAVARDVDIRVRVRVSVRAAGAPCFVFLVARTDGTNEYRPKLLFQTSGTLALHAGAVVSGQELPLASPHVISGLTYAPGAFYWLRAQITGAGPTTISVKVWADGSAEPSAWQFTATEFAIPAPGRWSSRAARVRWLAIDRSIHRGLIRRLPSDAAALILAR